MEYSNEVIKEADSVVEKYRPFAHTFGDCRQEENDNEIKNATHCAIQDRQSVLEEAYNYFKLSKEAKCEYIDLYLHDRIQFLTQQIEYLKSKI